MTDNFNRCCECTCSSAQLKAWGGCPRQFPTTKPGDLAPEREDRPVAGTGLVIALAIVFVGVISGALLAAAFNGGWR
jgi:hypothetical protein